MTSAHAFSCDSCGAIAALHYDPHTLVPQTPLGWWSFRDGTHACDQCMYRLLSDKDLRLNPPPTLDHFPDDLPRLLSSLPSA